MGWVSLGRGGGVVFGFVAVLVWVFLFVVVWWVFLWRRVLVLKLEHSCGLEQTATVQRKS